MRHAANYSDDYRWLWNFLGGPGSGKVTHCDTLMQEKRGVTHINMMDLLQQYAIGNGETGIMKNRLERKFKFFSSRQQNCKTFLNYPRER